MSTVINISTATRPNSAHIASDSQNVGKVQQTETVSRSGAGASNEAKKPNHVSNSVSRNIDLDTETRVLIVQTIDEHTNKVIRQYPSDVQLRLRTYLAASSAVEAKSVSFDRNA